MCRCIAASVVVFPVPVGSGDDDEALRELDEVVVDRWQPVALSGVGILSGMIRSDNANRAAVGKNELARTRALPPQSKLKSYCRSACSNGLRNASGPRRVATMRSMSSALSTCCSLDGPEALRQRGRPGGALDVRWRSVPRCCQATSSQGSMMVVSKMRTPSLWPICGGLWPIGHTLGSLPARKDGWCPYRGFRTEVPATLLRRRVRC